MDVVLHPAVLSIARDKISTPFIHGLLEGFSMYAFDAAVISSKFRSSAIRGLRTPEKHNSTIS